MCIGEKCVSHGRLHKKSVKKFLSELNEVIDIYFNSPFSLQCAVRTGNLLDFFNDRV